MNSVEQRARELLAESLRKHGRPRAADAVLREERDDFEESLDAIAAALREQPEAAPPFKPFVVKHYTGDEGPTIKGNGFDGLRLGEDREEAEEFVRWINARLAQQPVQEGGGEVVAHGFYDPATGAYSETQRTPRWLPAVVCAAPPSAPVGVELDAAALGRFAQDEWMDCHAAYPAWGFLTDAEQAAWIAVGERIKRVVSLTQQPAQAAPYNASDCIERCGSDEPCDTSRCPLPTPPGDDAAGGA